MPLTVRVNGMSNGLIHKGSMHFVMSTAPDVCKTPSPAGPVPIPYPVIISMSSDLLDGTTTVKADGNMAAIKGCQYMKCSGDEPGVAGGVVSNVNMMEAKFILFSFDVKLDGKNACRFTDPMTMNHQNTFCMGGNLPTQVMTVELRQKIQDIVCECEKEVNASADKSKETCRSMGTKKHDCCDEKIKKSGDPSLGGEQGYKNGRPLGESFKRHLARIKGALWPDAAILVDGKPAQFIDFKFGCPAGVGTRKPGVAPFAKGGPPPTWSRGQFDKYKKLSARLGIDIENNPPTIIDNAKGSCP